MTTTCARAYILFYRDAAKRKRDMLGTVAVLLVAALGRDVRGPAAAEERDGGAPNSAQSADDAI